MSARLPTAGWYVGLAGYFAAALWRDRARCERLARLVFDERWPVIPAFAKFTGVHKRDDQPSKRISAKTGPAVIAGGLQQPAYARMTAYKRAGTKDITWLRVDTGRMGEDWNFEAPFDLQILCRPEDAPGQSLDAAITLVHDFVTTTGARNATLGIWPTFDIANHDVTLIRTILDTRWGEYNISLPPAFAEQCGLVRSERKFIGKTWARHPRWGTYLNAAHVAAIGGIERIRAEVAPARIEPVGDLTYIQLTESWLTALAPETEQRRHALEQLMAPIIVRP